MKQGRRAGVTLSEGKLRYLAEAAALGSMRAASEKLDVAVSSISRQIAQLEAAIGLPLIERGRRTIKLTEAGEIALRFYRESMAHREAFGSSLQALRGLHAGEIQLATGEGLVSALSAMVQKFLARHAGVLLTVNTAGTLEVIRQVRDDEAHLGLVFHAPVDPKISVRASVAQPIKLIAHPRHPLAGERCVTLRQIREHRLCLPEATFRIRQMISLAESRENVSLNPDVNSNSLYLLKQLVKSGGYVTLLPEAAAIVEINRRELVSVPTDSTPLQDTSLNLISRLGRTLPTAPAAFLPILESGMRTWLTNSRGGSGEG
jgi:DNA-binding transcriptional LysR family regulator